MRANEVRPLTTYDVSRAFQLLNEVEAMTRGGQSWKVMIVMIGDDDRYLGVE